MSYFVKGCPSRLCQNYTKRQLFSSGVDLATGKKSICTNEQ